MPLTDQAFVDHALWLTRGLVDDLMSPATQHADGPALVQLGRLTEAMAAVDKLKDVPSWRFPQEGTALNGLNAGLAQVQATLQNVVTNPATYAASLATSLATNVDAMAQYLLACPVPAVSSGHLRGITAAAGEYRQLVEEAMGGVQAKLVEAQAAVAVLDQVRSQSESDATAALEELRAVIAQSKAEVTSQASRLDTAIREQGTAYNTHVVAWQKQVDDALEAAETNTGQAAVAAETAGIDQRAKYQELADQHLKSLALLEEQARNMVEATARNTTSTEYAQYAGSQSVVANRWSILAVATAIAGFVYVTTLLRNFDGVSPAEAIFKSTASAAILGAAGFMAREAAGCRREARDAKRTQLDLNAFEPFLVNLTPDHAEGLRINFANRVFHRPLANLRRNTRFDQPFGGSSNDQPFGGSSNNELNAEEAWSALGAGLRGQPWPGRVDDLHERMGDAINTTGQG